LGREIYSKRCIEPEPVLGKLSKIKDLKRFTLTKTAKVNIEFSLIAIAHNFSKWIAKIRLGNFNSVI
jgi:hypothetical protein